MKTIITGGTVVSSEGEFPADVLVDSGKIVALGLDLPRDGAQIVDASQAYVLPGGIDVHTHFQMPFGGTVSCETFDTGTKAAATGGTTMVVDFALQARGDTLMKTYADWRAMADGHVVVDYGLHMAITALDADSLAEIPLLVDEGVASLKLFMAYKGAIMVDDATLLLALQKGKECGALVCVHAENGDVIDVLVKEHLAAGKTAPKYHLSTRPLAAESEATRRAIMLAEIAEAPIYIVHVSCARAVDEIRAARGRGQAVYGETCPQYLALSVDDFDVPGFEGAKFICSPPLRDKSNWPGLWAAIRTGDLAVVASDHAAFNYAGQKEMGLTEGFHKVPNGCPGVEHRLFILHTLGVVGGEISMPKLVDVFSSAPARLFGLYPQKGVIAPGSDADVVVFDPAVEAVISAATQMQNIDYTPYEGMRVQGAVRTVLSRGEIVVSDGRWVGKEGAGRYVKAKPFVA
jgi:dihydropyrimidinase